MVAHHSPQIWQVILMQEDCQECQECQIIRIRVKAFGLYLYAQYGFY